MKPLRYASKAHRQGCDSDKGLPSEECRYQCADQCGGRLAHRRGAGHHDQCPSVVDGLASPRREIREERSHGEGEGLRHAEKHDHASEPTLYLMAFRCPCALPGPCADKSSDAHLASAARVIGRDSIRSMEVTLAWLMSAYSELTWQL